MSPDDEPVICPLQPAEPSLPTLAEYPLKARAADAARWAAEDREDEIDDTHWRVAKALGGGE